MTDFDRTKYLRIALLPVGLIFLFGIYPLTVMVVAILLALLMPRGQAVRTG